MRGTFPGSHLYFSISHSFYFNWLHELNQYQPNYPSALSFFWCLIQSLLGDSEDEVSLLLSFCFVTNHLLTNWEPESSRFFFFFFYPNIHFSWQLDTVMIWCVIWACLGSCVVSVQAVRAAHFVWTSRQIQTSHVWFCVKSVCHHLLLQGFCPSSICHRGFEDDAFVSFNNSVTFYSLNFEIFKEKLISKQHFHSSPTPDTGAHCRFTAACSVVDDLLGFSHFFSSYFLNENWN